MRNTSAVLRLPWPGGTSILLLALVFFTACGGGSSSSSSSSSGSSSSSSAVAPTASFTFSPSAPSVNVVTQFTDASTGTPTSWNWNFGDGTTSTAQNPTHAFGTTGTFTVTLTAGNAKGSSTKTQTVAVGTRTVGLMINDSRAFNGYTLFSPKQNTMTYLINNEGRIINQWTASKYAPGQSAYLLENGHLLRACMTKGKLSSGGGEGGRIEEYDWEGKLVWEFDVSTDTYMQHHDIHMLPNGNVLMLVVEKKTYAEAIAAGFRASQIGQVQSQGYMLPDSVIEVQPTRPVGGKIVWEWHVWDHLIQDVDATKANYGDVAARPELISTTGDGKALPAFWNHMNSIDYNAAFDQIAVSVRGNSEVWIIDHGTTTAQAAGHSGGRRGKGGDLLYRWGNPLTYRAGTAADQKYFQQHDVEWVPADCPGAGNLTCFDNGLGRGNYSTVEEITPPVDANGNYAMTAGSAALPKTYTWMYQGTSANPMYSENISGAHRLPDGHTIICSGTVGEFLEVTMGGEIVWRYICPVDQNGPMKQGATPAADPARTAETMNSVFRIYKYPTTYPAFTGRTLTPGNYVELY